MSSASMTPRAVPWGQIASMVSTSFSQGLTFQTDTTVNMEAVEVDSSFSWSEANDELTCNFDGRVLPSWSADMDYQNDVRTGTDFYVEHDDGGGYAEVTGTRGGVYQRQSTISGSARVPVVVTVSSGDKLRLRAYLRDGDPSQVNIRSRGCNFLVQRIQGAS